PAARRPGARRPGPRGRGRCGAPLPGGGPGEGAGAGLMEYADRGSSGLVVSRLVLGMMSYGDTSRRAWHLDLDAARPIVRRAGAGGVSVIHTREGDDRG